MGTESQRWSHSVVGVALLLVTLSASGAWAQDSDSGASEVSLFVGSHLPNQIDGVTEILPVFGGRYGLSTMAGIVELGLSNSHAEGVDFTTISGSLRSDLPAIDEFLGTVYGGLDLHYYRPAGVDNRMSETGAHIGAGLLMHASNTLWFRGDLRFAVNPGTSLMLLFGISFRPEESAQ